MKIRLKLTLVFTVITTLILVGLSIAIYYFFSLYRQIEFYNRLKGRAVIIAHAYLGEDDVSERKLNETKMKYRQYLPEEIVGIFKAPYNHSAIEDSMRVKLPEDFTHTLEETEYIELKSGERQIVALWYPDTHGTFIIMVSSIDQFGMRMIVDLQKILIACLFVSIGIVFASGRFFSRQALKPINKIIKDVNQVGLSNLHVRLQTDGSKDEISELTTTFNLMLERIETSLEIQKNFISNASHELKNPLTAIIGEVELQLNRERSAEQYKAALQTIAYEARRLDNLTAKLLNLAQTGFDEKILLTDEVRIDELLIGITDDLNNLVPGHRIQINFENIPEDDKLITIRGNKRLLHAALVNVIENACKFSENQEVDILVKAGNQILSVVVTDTGIGIAEEDLKNIFQPFYRASNARAFKGSGIGLSLTEKIVRMHGGDIEVKSTLNQSTRFTISFHHHASRLKL